MQTSALPTQLSDDFNEKRSLFFALYLNNPIKLPEFQPLSRDDIWESLTIENALNALNADCALRDSEEVRDRLVVNNQFQKNHSCGLVCCNRV